MKKKIKIEVCPYCNRVLDQDKHDKRFYRCEPCDYNYYLVKHGKLESLPVSGVRSIRHVSEMMKILKK